MRPPFELRLFELRSLPSFELRSLPSFELRSLPSFELRLLRSLESLPSFELELLESFMSSLIRVEVIYELPSNLVKDKVMFSTQSNHLVSMEKVYLQVARNAFIREKSEREIFNAFVSLSRPKLDLGMYRRKVIKPIERKIFDVCNRPAMISKVDDKSTALEFLSLIYEVVINEGVDPIELENNCKVDGEFGNGIVKNVMKKWKDSSEKRVKKFEVEVDDEVSEVLVKLGGHQLVIDVPKNHVDLIKQNSKLYTAVNLFYESLFAFGQTISVSPYEMMKKYFELETKGPNAKKIVICDGFASPFNNHISNGPDFITGSYCSMFPYLEREFGSIGNFFSSKVKISQFKNWWINPPYTEEIMERAIEKVLKGMDGKDVVTGTTIMVSGPTWEDSSYYQLLKKSKYLIMDDHFKFEDVGAEMRREGVEIKSDLKRLAIFVLRKK